MSKVLIPNARLSFPSLFKKAVFEGKETKYEATLLFPKTDKKTYKALMDVIEECKTENKLKTPFIDQIELLHFSIFLPLSVKRNNSFYLFNIKEFLFENITPPPEVV